MHTLAQFDIMKSTLRTTMTMTNSHGHEQKEENDTKHDDSIQQAAQAVKLNRRPTIAKYVDPNAILCRRTSCDAAGSCLPAVHLIKGKSYLRSNLIVLIITIWVINFLTIATIISERGITNSINGDVQFHRPSFKGAVVDWVEKRNLRGAKEQIPRQYIDEEKLHQKLNREKKQQHGIVDDKDEWFLSTISHNIRYMVTGWMSRKIEDVFDTLY